MSGRHKFRTNEWLQRRNKLTRETSRALGMVSITAGLCAIGEVAFARVEEMPISEGMGDALTMTLATAFVTFAGAKAAADYRHFRILPELNGKTAEQRYIESDLSIFDSNET